MNFTARFPVQRYGIPQSRTKGGSISRLLRLTTNDSRYGPNIARRISKTAPLWWGRRLRASKAESWMPSALRTGHPFGAWERLCPE